jgi:hypothetical protein
VSVLDTRISVSSVSCVPVSGDLGYGCFLLGGNQFIHLLERDLTYMVDL